MLDRDAVVDMSTLKAGDLLFPTLLLPLSTELSILATPFNCPWLLLTLSDERAVPVFFYIC